MSTEALNSREKIWQVVASIPLGKVCSYGQVAIMAGLPGAARQVGRVLKHIPEGSQLPWHRVINAKGEISLPVSSDGYYIQKRRLQAEGIVFNKRGRINLQHFGWQP